MRRASDRRRARQVTRRLAILIAIGVIVVVGGVVLGIGSPVRPSSSGQPSAVGGEPSAVVGESALGGQPPRVADRDPGGDADLISAIPSITLARSTNPSGAYASAGGAPLKDADGNPLTIEAGWDLAVFEGPTIVEGEPWYRVYVLPDASRGPTDYFTWVRGATIAFKDPVACPDGRGISILGAADPFTRARCVGPGSFVLRGWTWDRMLGTWYRITPEWLGGHDGPIDSTLSLFEDRSHHGGNGGAPFPFLELQLPPGLEHPPFEFQVDAAVHFGDSLSGECVRRTDQFNSVPDDGPRDGPVWCTTRLVVEQWTPLLGPEQRAIDAATPQLHRHPERGPNTACAGVGMPPLVFRMDPSQLDPVWLEVAEGGLGAPVGFRIIPSFDPGFRAVFGPGLVIVDERGAVVAQNGTPVNPDGELAGHFICSTGRVVYFD